MDEDNIISESGIISLSDKQWTEARKRAEIISVIAKYDNVSNAIAGEAASRLNLSTRTIYRLIRKWRDSDRSIAALAPDSSKGGKGSLRLPNNVELLISQAISDIYLSKQRPSVAALMRIIKERCHKVGLNYPAVGTVRARIKRLQADKVLSLREGLNAVRKLHPITGQFPKTNNPMEIVQIDHTLVDIIIVDTFNRQTIGRPWITIAIDTYSRSIIGFCLTLEAPSATSVGLCLAHAVIDKRPWLERIDLEVEWPMLGKPKLLYVDNGAEFHSEALRRGCDVHGIKISYRPVGSPHYGGIVERVIGTMMKMVHELPGTTFSNITERGEYNSEKKAALTLSELEKWFALAIASYHGSIHSGICETPMNRWKKVVDLGWNYSYVQDPKAFLVDFLPIIYRHIQRQGFVIDHIAYTNSSLKPLITKGKSENKFLIRRDPRDLSRIYVLDPVANHYIEVPYRAISNPAITLWEHRFAVKRIRDEGRKTVNEEEIIKIICKMRQITETAVVKSKSARRQVARLESLKGNITLASLPNIGAKIEPDKDRLDFTKIKPFDDIEEW